MPIDAKFIVSTILIVSLWKLLTRKVLCYNLNVGDGISTFGSSKSKMWRFHPLRATIQKPDGRLDQTGNSVQQEWPIVCHCSSDIREIWRLGTKDQRFFCSRACYSLGTVLTSHCWAIFELGIHDVSGKKNRDTRFSLFLQLQVSWAHAAGVCWTVLFICRIWGSAIIQVIPKRSRFFFLVSLITSTESFSNSFLLSNQLDRDWGHCERASAIWSC